MSFSDTECSHRSSLATAHRVPAVNVSQQPASSSSSRGVPSAHEIVSNPETSELFLEYLTSAPQTTSLGTAYAIVLGLKEKQGEESELRELCRAVYKTYIENESIFPWLSMQRRLQLREAFRHKQFDEHFFNGVLDDLLVYCEIETDIFRQFFNTRIWNEYRRAKFASNHAQMKSSATISHAGGGYSNENELKRSRKLHSSSLSLQTKTKSSDRHNHSHHHNRSARIESIPTRKTRVAYFLPGSDTPFVIQVGVSPEMITLNHILPRLHTSRSVTTAMEYFVKHRATNENWLGGDTQFINEKIDDFDLPLPNIDGTVVIRMLNNS